MRLPWFNVLTLSHEEYIGKVLNAVFALPPNVHLLDITGPAHIFYEAACYGAPLQLSFCTIFREQRQSISSSTLAFHQLIPYDQLLLNAGDLIFIPGLDASLLLDDHFLNSCHGFLAWLKQQHHNGVLICSVCTGAFLLAASGLLDGRCCTTHWKYTERLRLKYPLIKVQPNRLFTQDDRIYTSAGVSSGIDLALHLIQQTWGARFAVQIAKEVVIYFRRGPDDPQLNIFTQYRNHLDHRIHLVQDCLAQALDKKLSHEELAEKVNMSPRNLTRLFKHTTGITIGAYLKQLRKERADQLISEGQTVQATASDCGLKSTNQLRHLLKSKKLLEKT